MASAVFGSYRFILAFRSNPGDSLKKITKIPTKTQKIQQQKSITRLLLSTVIQGLITVHQLSKLYIVIQDCQPLS